VKQVLTKKRIAVKWSVERPKGKSYYLPYRRMHQGKSIEEER